MQILYRRCCGLDVHKKSITACILNADGSPDRIVKKREFATHTDAAKAAVLAVCQPGDARGHGILRSLLEAGVPCAGRQARDPAGQSGQRVLLIH